MKNIAKKVGYLKGLMEAAEFDESTLNGKLVKGVVDVLGDLSDRVEVIDELLDDLNDYVESIDDDLSALEDDNFDEDSVDFSDDDEDEDYDDFDDGEDQLHLLHTDAPADDEDENEDEDEDALDTLAGGLCPECNRMFFIRLEDSDDARYVCPHCGKTVDPIPLTPENAPIAHPVEE